MEGFEKEYYQHMIRMDTQWMAQDSPWTQFEMDLIRYIRDDYPVIYTKVGVMTRYQRAGKIRTAWKQISNKFPELPMTYIKARWRSILDNYLKVKIYADSKSGFTETLVKNKFMDGTLSFLEGEVDLFYDHHKPKKNKNKDTIPGTEYDDDNEANPKSYEVDIRESLHEEVDLYDEDPESALIKKEYSDSDSDDTNETATETTHNMVEVKTEPNNTWTEEELMNATRLTKDMIDQLILIKIRNYYMSPVVSK